MKIGTKNPFTREQLIDRAFYRVAYILHHWWEEGLGHYDTRILDILVPDDYVLAGSSVRGSDRREHVVPRRELCEQAFLLFAREATVNEVAAYLRKYLRIVLVSKEEANLLDKGDSKQKMPPEWSPVDGDPFERLTRAGIKWTSIPSEA